jgi:hypothetical protein
MPANLMAYVDTFTSFMRDNPGVSFLLAVAIVGVAVWFLMNHYKPELWKDN